MIECSEYVDRKNWNKFYSILGSCNGRFKFSPYIDEHSTSFYVTYYFESSDDYGKFYNTYHMLTTNIVETRASKLDNFKRKIKKLFRG